MKDFDYYNGRDIDYPKRPKKPYLPSNANSEVYKMYSVSLANYEKELDKFNEEGAIYRALINKRVDEFKKDMFNEFGVSNNPKREECYRIAYDYGHSSGCQEVYNYFAEFVNLIT